MESNEFVVLDEMYRAEAEEARETLSVAGLVRPGPRRYWHLKYDCGARVRYSLYLVSPRPGGQGRMYHLVARWVLDYLPLTRQNYAGQRVETQGRTVEVGKRNGARTQRVVRVVVDALGLPVPVPQEWYEAAVAAQRDKTLLARGKRGEGHG